MASHEVGRALAALRPVRRRACAYCQALVIASGRRLYCSRACQAQAYRRRREAIARERRRDGIPDDYIPGVTHLPPRPFDVPAAAWRRAVAATLARPALPAGAPPEFS